MSYGNGGTVAGGYAGVQIAPPARLTMIAEQMSTLENRTEVLTATIAELDARLSPIVRPEPPSAEGKREPVPTVPVALGANLSQMNDRLALLNMRLRSLIDRIEL